MYESTTLSGKTAFIAGGTSGINLAIAEGLAKVGANLVLLGRDQEKADSAAAQIVERYDVRAIATSADVREPEQVEQAIQRAVEKFGKLDIVISGAAGNFLAPAIALSPKGFKTVIDIDLLGTYNVFHLAFQHCVDDASFVAITAPQATTPMPYQSHVCAAKAGINMLVKTLAMEWGPRGVRVNAISPGPVGGTEGMKRLTPTQADIDDWNRKTPLRRFAEGDEIANAAVFLCSDLGKYATGSILTVDGGIELGDSSPDALSPPKRQLI